MTKAALVEEIQNYKPWNHAEDTNRLLLLYFLKTGGETCFDNDNTDGHVTATCFIINKAGDKTLFLHHRALDRWFAPGGHCDGQPNVLKAAGWEGEQEAGLTDLKPASSEIFDIDVHQIPANVKKNMPEHLHYSITYLFVADSMDFVRDDREAIDMAWLTPEEALEKQGAPDYHRLVAKWVNFTSKNVISPQ